MKQLDYYIVVDLPDTISSKVLEFRRLLDPYVAALPAEITIAGSSGVGTLIVENDIESVLKFIGRALLGHKRFTTYFDGITSFPRSNTFYLNPAVQKPFQALHRRLKDSPLKFHHSPYSYYAHCSISLKSDYTKVESIISNLQHPQEKFEISSVSLYGLEKAGPFTHRIGTVYLEDR